MQSHLPATAPAPYADSFFIYKRIVVGFGGCAVAGDEGEFLPGSSVEAALDFTGRKRFLDHLRQCGFVNSATKSRKAVSGALTGPQRKMFSLWQQLADAKVVEDRRMSALVAFAKRQTGVERLEWLKSKQEDLLIESLKQWLHRSQAVT